jgi:hypothetical protein
LSLGIQIQLSREYGCVQPKVTQSSIVKAWASQDPFGSEEEQYGKLESLCQAILTSDPEASCELRMDNFIFHSFFWSYGAAKHFFSYQRKLISCDGASMRGLASGNIFLLTSEDSEDEQVILAVMFTNHNESIEEWSYFLKMCKNHIIGLDSKDVGLISDRDKGIFWFLIIM